MSNVFSNINELGGRHYIHIHHLLSGVMQGFPSLRTSIISGIREQNSIRVPMSGILPTELTISPPWKDYSRGRNCYHFLVDSYSIDPS